MLLTLAACGGNDAATPSASQTPVIPVTPTPTVTAKPTPVDPTTAAKAKILADYAAYFAYAKKGIRYGGAGYAYERWMVDGALSSWKSYIGAIKGVRGGKVTGDSRLLESKVTALDLKAKVPTATVLACIDDGFTTVAKDGKVIARPGGKVTRQDKVKLLNGRWMVYYTQGGNASYGCTR
jgi:hypothetical protein